MEHWLNHLFGEEIEIENRTVTGIEHGSNHGRRACGSGGLAILCLVTAARSRVTTGTDVRVPRWFINTKDPLDIVPPLCCATIAVPCWDVFLVIFGASTAYRGLTVAKEYPGITGQSTCRFALKMHYLLPGLLVLTYFALFCYVRFGRMGAWATLVGAAVAAFAVLLVEAIGYFGGK
jgi:hypothetical protein